MKITKSKEWYLWAKRVSWICAWLFCIVPTAVVGIIKLPAIVAPQPEQTLTGSAIVVIACCAYPVLKGFFRYFKNPSAWFIMWIVALITFALYRISRETLGAMVWIFFAAAIGNSIGAILFKLADNFNEKWKFCGEITLKGDGT